MINWGNDENTISFTSMIDRNPANWKTWLDSRMITEVNNKAWKPQALITNTS